MLDKISHVSKVKKKLIGVNWNPLGVDNFNILEFVHHLRQTWSAPSYSMTYGSSLNQCNMDNNRAPAP